MQLTNKKYLHTYLYLKMITFWYSLFGVVPYNFQLNSTDGCIQFNYP